MHIPELTGVSCPVTFALAAAGLAAASAFAVKSKTKPSAQLFASTSVFIFIAQMLNYPILAGTSGHILGGTLAVCLLGPVFGVLAMSLVILVQCGIGDGGLTALGANVVNMAFLGTLPAILCHRFFVRENRSTHHQIVAYGFAAWCSVMLAAAACAVQVSVSHSISDPAFSASMLSVHALIGAGEMAMTVALLVLLTSRASQRSPLVPVLVLGIVGLLLTPIASTLPDGLESVLAHFIP